MIEIKKVATKQEYRQFVDFPRELYRGVKNYVPYIRMDELALFDPKRNAYSEDVDSDFFLCFKDGKIAGRVAALSHKQRNQLADEKKVRFSRFDCINDVEVARALLGAVEEVARRQGLEVVHGPMGYSDVDKEAMLVEGFERPGTFITLYNYDYYPKLLEQCGYVKDVDWVEYLLKMPDQKYIDRVNSLGDKLMKRYNLHFAEARTKSEFLNKYADDFFEIIAQSYAHLYGVVPYNDAVRKQLLSNFKLLINKDFICILLNSENKPVGCALIFPSIGEILNKHEGRMTPLAILELLKFVSKPTKIELGIIGVMPQYFGKGYNAILISRMLEVISKHGITEVETNPELETNKSVQSQWDGIEKEQIKRRRVYTKTIGQN